MVALGIIRKLLMGAALVAVPVGAFAQLSISVNIAPPLLPVYAQPLCPGDGYLWTPGYWAYEPQGYFWVPGVWVEPPTVGYLWTPAYWGFNDGGYRFFPGYWGPHIGFYGGVNYGFGYFGHGYEGGYWDRDRFFYNRSVNNINERYERNVYVRNVTVVNNYNRVGYNGGEGIHEGPRHEDLQAQRERHYEPTLVQQAHQQFAARDRGQFANVNGGRPQVEAVRTPQEFQQRGQRGPLGGNAVPINNNVPINVQNIGEARQQGQQPVVTRQQTPVQQEQVPGQQRGQWQGRQGQPQHQVAQPGGPQGQASQPQLQQRGQWQGGQQGQPAPQTQQQAHPAQQRGDWQDRQRQGEQQQAQQQQSQQQQMRSQPQAQPQQLARPQEGGRSERGDHQRR